MEPTEDSSNSLDIELSIEPSIEPLEIPVGGTRTNRIKNYAWLAKISTITLDLCGSDLNQRIEVSCVGGLRFITEIVSGKNEEGLDVLDQKQFNLLTLKKEKLFTIDFSKDRKSFHVMEPDSSTFIGFFTLDDPTNCSNVIIHNVIDDEIYQVEVTESHRQRHRRLVIKSTKGEEMGTISNPAPKWTQFLSGRMTLNLTADDRGGLTSREKAILLGFLIGLGIVGMDYWKRSSSGLLTFYVFALFLFAILLILIYSRFHEERVKPPLDQRQL